MFKVTDLASLTVTNFMVENSIGLKMVKLI